MSSKKRGDYRPMLQPNWAILTGDGILWVINGCPLENDLLVGSNSRDISSNLRDISRNLRDTEYVYMSFSSG